MASKQFYPLTGKVRLNNASPVGQYDFQPGNRGEFVLNDIAYAVIDVATGKTVDVNEPALLLELTDVQQNTNITNGPLPLNALRKLLPFRLPAPIDFGKGNTLKARVTTEAAAVAGSAAYDVYVTLIGELETA